MSDFVAVLPKFGFRYDFPWLFKSSPKYSDVVDFSHFDSFDRDKVSMQSGVDSGAGVGSYDFNDGKINDVLLPDKALIALREGRLDRTEVDKLRELYDKQYKADVANAKSAAQKKKLEKQYSEQMQIISDYLGVKSDTESDSTDLLQNNTK